jgi:hypothetical protein
MGKAAKNPSTMGNESRLNDARNCETELRRFPIETSQEDRRLRASPTLAEADLQAFQTFRTRP